MAEDIGLYDTSNYPKDHMLYSDRNGKVLDKMKGECQGRTITEAIAIRPKMYSVLEENQTNIRKAKGVKKNMVEKKVRREYYKELIFARNQFWREMNIPCSEGHEIYGMHVNKVSLSPFDTKRWIEDDGVHTLAYGHKDIKERH